jgi:hypothetical protein
MDPTTETSTNNTHENPFKNLSQEEFAKLLSDTKEEIKKARKPTAKLLDGAIFGAGVTFVLGIALTVKHFVTT